MCEASVELLCHACGSARLHRSHRRGAGERLVSAFRGVAPYRCEDCGKRSFGPRGHGVRRRRRLTLAEQMQRLERAPRSPRWALVLAALVSALLAGLALLALEAAQSSATWGFLFD